MNDDRQQPAAPAPSGDPWGNAARRFYARSATTKADPARRRAFVRAYKHIGDHLRLDGTQRLIDIGCGAGEFAAAIDGRVRSYVGCDISFESLRLARAAGIDSALFIQADAARLPCNGSFDRAVMITSLEFIADKHQVLTQLQTLLAPDGLLYVEVRNADFILLRMAGAIPWLTRKMSLVHAYPADGFRDLGLAEWRAILEKSGFEIEDMVASSRPVWYGDIPTRLRNLLIAIIRRCTPLKWHYMAGFICRKRSAA
jgi:ubiquinone/menaquinone biosynthesis C-methylase UbiE